MIKRFILIVELAFLILFLAVLLLMALINLLDLPPLI
jgi:hypothetical protein